MNTLFGEKQSYASFNEEKSHRLWLYREWDIFQNAVMYIGLNPSTADEKTDDATIRRLRGLTSGNGYGAFYMCNLFTYISTSPAKLNGLEWSTGMKDEILLNISKKVEVARVVFCWGNFKIAEARLPQMLALFPDAWCFGKNANGSPKHPLYLPGNTKLVKFVN